MSIIVESTSFEVGRYTVCQRPRFDSPAWAVYTVYLRGKVIGKSFSRPDVGCCEWLERQTRDEIVYAESSVKLPDKGREHAVRGLVKAHALNKSAKQKRKRLRGGFDDLWILRLPDLEETA